MVALLRPYEPQAFLEPSWNWNAKQMVDEIHHWFVNHNGSEFQVPTRDHPYSIVPARAGASCVLYTTKPRCLVEVLSRESGEIPCGVIGRYGLPCEEDVECLASIVGERSFLFVGDVDPSDLLIFAWLRSRTTISYQGLTDTLLERCGVALDDRVITAQSEDEIASMSLVTKHIPDHRALLGSGCSRLLLSGRKVEVEALTAFAKLAAGVLIDALITRCGTSRRLRTR